jgi:hypothetical protein
MFVLKLSGIQIILWIVKFNSFYLSVMQIESQWDRCPYEH